MVTGLSSLILVCKHIYLSMITNPLCTHLLVFKSVCMFHIFCIYCLSTCIYICRYHYVGIYQSPLMFNRASVSTSLCLYSQVSMCTPVIRHVHQFIYVLVSWMITNQSLSPVVCKHVHWYIYVLASLFTN